MAYCQQCGKELAEGAKFCTECGTAVAAATAASAEEKIEEVKEVVQPEPVNTDAEIETVEEPKVVEQAASETEQVQSAESVQGAEQVQSTQPTQSTEQAQTQQTQGQGQSQYQQTQSQPQYQNQQYQQQAYDPRKSRTLAGILGILFGAFGVHNFYLGYTAKAVIQLCVSILGLLLCCVGIGVIVITGIAIWGMIEGIMILAGSINTDGKGVPLRD